MDRDRLIDFQWAEVVTPMIYPPKPRLVVRGLKPRPDLDDPVAEARTIDG